MEQKPDNKGKIFTIIFLLVIILPVSYALFRAFVLEPKKANTTQPAKQVEQK